MKKKFNPEDFLSDRLEGEYLEEERENLFGDDEFEGEEETEEEDEEMTVEEMCGEIGVDANILRSIIESDIMPQVIEDARALTASRAMREFADGSWEMRRLEALSDEGFSLADAVERVKHEQLEKRVKMLEKQLDNRKRTLGSTYSKAKTEFDD